MSTQTVGMSEAFETIRYLELPSFIDAVKANIARNILRKYKTTLYQLVLLTTLVLLCFTFLEFCN